MLSCEGSSLHKVVPANFIYADLPGEVSWLIGICMPKESLQLPYMLLIIESGVNSWCDANDNTIAGGNMMLVEAQDRNGNTKIIWLMRVYAFHRPVSCVGLARFPVIAPLSVLAAFAVSFQASEVVEF